MPLDIQLVSARMRGAIIALVVVAVLYLGKAVFIPIAMAVLLSFVLAPLVALVERLRIGRIVSVIVVQFAWTILLVMLLTMLGTQLIELSGNLPEYKRNIVQRAEEFRSLLPTGLFEAQSALADIENEVMDDEEAASSEDVARDDNAIGDKIGARDVSAVDKQLADDAVDSSTADSSEARDKTAKNKGNGPVEVAVVSNRAESISKFLGFINPVLGPIGTLGIVIVLTIFILLDRENFRNRVVQLFGSSNLAIATRAITDATDRSMTWLRTMVWINSMYAAAVTVGLTLFGLPNALLWGGLAFFCRFLPYVGPWIGAAIPVLLSLGVFSGWALPLGIVAMYIVLELIVNLILEPWLYGRSLGLTSIGIVLAAIFWTWMWGPAGLLVAVPVTMWLVVLGLHIPQMSHFTLLFGDLSEMPSYHSLYQRLLAFDHPEATTILKRHFEQDGPSDVFDLVLAPLFQRLSLDRQSGFVDEQQTDSVYNTIHEHIEDLTEETGRSDPATEPTSVRQQSKILVIPTGGKAEEIMADLLRLMSLQELGRDVELMGSGQLSNEILEQIHNGDADAVVFCCSTAGSQTKVRAVCKRLPRAERCIPLFLWQASDPNTHADLPNRHHLDVDAAFSSVAEVVEQLARVNQRVTRVDGANNVFSDTPSGQHAVA